MSAELIVVTGSHSGRRIPLLVNEVVLGRDPASDLQFDPHEDLTVSGSHAAVSWTGTAWAIRDLGSLNGTSVNGEKISAMVVLRANDRIQLGAGGPEVEFRLSPRTDPAVIPPRTGDGIRRARDSSRRLWSMVAVLTLILAGVTLLALHSWRQGQEYRVQVQAMQERVDSILDSSAATAEALEGRIQGLHEALATSREDLQAVRGDLQAARQAGNTVEIAALRAQLQEAQAAVVRFQLAAELDYERIEAANRRAVAKVFVDFGNEVVAATAFAVRADGTLLTSRHVVTGTPGRRPPRRLAVQFADSRQVWPARTLETSPTEDLALIKVDNIVGEVPTIQGLNRRPDTLRTGQGLAIIGFPLASSSRTVEGQEDFARATVTAGIVRAVTEEILEVNGYGVEGSSGSPLIDGGGEVVGILFGGRVENDEKTLFAVPANRVAAFLDRNR